MTEITNSTDLVNALSNNASLTVTNDGRIQKQSFLGSIFQKIGDFFSSQSKIEQRQARLEEAMINLLNQDAEGNSIADVSGLTKDKLSKYSTRLKIEAEKFSLYAKTASASPQVATFARDFITNTLNLLTESLKSETSKEVREALMKETMTSLNAKLDRILQFRTSDQLTPEEQENINTTLKDSFQKYVDEQMSNEFKTNPNVKICKQFKGDYNRQTTNLDGKIYTPKSYNGIEKQLTDMFPNPKTSYFLSWCLSQTLFGTPTSILIQPQMYEMDYNSKVPENLIGGRQPTDNPEEIDDSISFTQGLDLRYDLKPIKDGNKIVGVELKAECTIGIRNEVDGNSLLATTKNSLALKIDLREPNSPKITSFDCKFSVPDDKKSPANNPNVKSNTVTNNQFSEERQNFMKELSKKLNRK